MSLGSKVALGMAGLTAVGTLAFVVGNQIMDKKNMNDGVLRDIQRQQMKKIENLYWLEKQIEMTRILKKNSEDRELALKLLENSKPNS